VTYFLQRTERLLFFFGISDPLCLSSSFSALHFFRLFIKRTITYEFSQQRIQQDTIIAAAAVVVVDVDDVVAVSDAVCISTSRVCDNEVKVLAVVIHLAR
jgi:hypothetical protein